MKTTGKQHTDLLVLAVMAVTFLFVACSKNDPIVPRVIDTDQSATPDGNGEGAPEPDYRFLRTLTYSAGEGSRRRIFSYDGEVMVREDFVFDGMKAWSSRFAYEAQNQLEVQSLCAAGDVTNDSGLDFKCGRILELRSYSYTAGKLDLYGTEKLDEGGNILFTTSVTLNQDNRGNIISELYNNGPNTSQNHSYIYTDQDNIRKKRVAYLPANTTEELTYEVDDGINPFYPLWKAFGYYREPADDETLLSPMFSPHNVTKVYVDNVLRLEVDYNYDAKGYPLSASFKRYVSASSFREGAISYTYAN